MVKLQVLESLNAILYFYYNMLLPQTDFSIWKSEGLPLDDLSIENAMVILQVLETLNLLLNFIIPYFYLKRILASGRVKSCHRMTRH